MRFFEALEQKVLQAIPELTLAHTWANDTLLFVQPRGWEAFEAKTPDESSGSDWAFEFHVYRLPDESLRLRAFWYDDRARKHASVLKSVLKREFTGVDCKESLGGSKERYDRFELGVGLNVERLISLLNVWQRRLAEAVAQAPLEAIA